MAPDIRNLKASSLVEKWHKASVVEKMSKMIKRTEAGKGLPKVKLPLLEGKSKYLHFALALHEQMKDFTNNDGVYEANHLKLFKLIKEAMSTTIRLTSIQSYHLNQCLQ